MPCDTCSKNLIVGNVYNLTGGNTCARCASPLILTPNQAVYQGISGSQHSFVLKTPQKCGVCGLELSIGWMPCYGTDLADVLFSAESVGKTIDKAKEAMPK